jgi:hypothetical protein
VVAAGGPVRGRNAAGTPSPIRIPAANTATAARRTLDVTPVPSVAPART